MGYETLLELLKNRHSDRYFGKKPIEKEVIEKILAAATLSPSVDNTQPWHFHILENPTVKAQMMQYSCYGNFVVGSATFIMISCDKSAKGSQKATIWNPREMEYSCAVAMHSMMIAATALGIGSCWVSLHHGPAHDLLKLPDHHVVIGGMMLGYVEEAQKKAPNDHERRSLAQSVTYYT